MLALVYYAQPQSWLTTNPATVNRPLRLHGTELKIEYTTAFAFAAGATGGNSQKL